MTTVVGSACCAACANGTDMVFTNHLNNCLKNLEGEYEVVRRHRDQLIRELDDMKRAEAERMQVADSVHKLSAELTQLRLENKDYRAKEERLLADRNLHFVPRSDFEKLMEEHKHMLQDLSDLECKDKLFNEVSLRAARTQAQLTTLEAEMTANRNNSQKLEDSNRELSEEVRTLRTTNAELLGRVHALEAELGPATSAADKHASLSSAYEALKASHAAATAQVAELTTKTNAQNALVTYLTEQLGGKGAVQGEAERLQRANERLTAELQVVRSELETCNKTLHERTASLEETRVQLANVRGEWSTEALQLHTDAARMQAELGIAQRALEEARKQVQELTDRLQEQTNKADAARASADSAAREGGSAALQRDALQRQVEELEARLHAVNERQGSLLGSTGKSAAELERAVAGLKKELCVEQLANKRLSSELNDCRADRDAAVAVYRKLQARYALVKQEFERAQTENNALKRDTAQLAQLRQVEADAMQRAAELAAELKQAQSQLAQTRQELAARVREVDALRSDQSSSAEGLVGEARRLAQENNSLRADLAQVMSSFDKLKLLADHYKAQLGSLQEASGAAHTCAKGKRCPCKTRPPPPSRWQN